MTARLVLLAVFLLAARAPGQEAPAPPRPVSVQELSLLLRSGYTGDEVLRETTGRPLLAPLAAAAEHALHDFGIDYYEQPVASATEAANTQQRQAAADQYRLDAWAAEQARRADAGRASMQTKLATRREEALKEVSTSLHDKLVAFTHNRLEPYDNVALASKRLFLLYVAAGSDKNSVKLTPPLVDFYKKFAPEHPEFETILISADRSAAEMESYLRQTQIPWPALAYEQLATQPDLAALRQAGLPRYVLINGGGETLADSLENGKLVNPQHVFDVLLKQKAP